MQNLLKNTNVQSLGSQIISWTYKPAKAQKTIFAILAVIGGLALAVILYGSQFFPWLKKFGSYVLYIAVFALSPLVKYFVGLSKDYYYELYDHGFLIHRRSAKGLEPIKSALWEEFNSCQKLDKGVKLVTRMPFERGVVLYAKSNIMEVLSICREKINIAKSVGMAQRQTLTDWKRQNKSRGQISSQRKYLPE